MTPTPGIAVRLRLPDAVEADSEIGGTLAITNEGEETVEVVRPHYNAALNLVVFDRLWNAVPATPLGKEQVAYERTPLPPGRTVEFELDGLAFTTGTSRMGYALEPGVYRVLAVYHPGTERLPERSSYPIAVPSNVETLAVRDSR